MWPDRFARPNLSLDKLAQDEILCPKVGSRSATPLYLVGIDHQTGENHPRPFWGHKNHFQVPAKKKKKMIWDFAPRDFPPAPTRVANRECPSLPPCGPYKARLVYFASKPSGEKFRGPCRALFRIIYSFKYPAPTRCFDPTLIRT